MNNQKTLYVLLLKLEELRIYLQEVICIYRKCYIYSYHNDIIKKLIIFIFEFLIFILYTFKIKLKLIFDIK